MEREDFLVVEPDFSMQFLNNVRYVLHEAAVKADHVQGGKKS